MSRFRVFTACEQVAGHLREELLRGTWTGMMPGEDRLKARLGVGRNTIKAALRLLEEEGLLEGRGAGCQRRITAPEIRKRSALRIRILLYEGIDRGLPDKIELLARLQEAGFAVSFASKSLHDLLMDPVRVAKFVTEQPADAWVVSAGSREVLEWFAAQEVPAIAMYGRFTGLPIAAASPRNAPAMVQAVGRLVDLGHRRIVMLVGEERRKPFPALFERLFLEELAGQGLPVGQYNLPDWDGHADGLRGCLDSMFRHTPPTAIFCGETRFFVAVQQYLARRGIHAPERVSLICSDPGPSFVLCKPEVSHFHWDHKPVVRRIVRWADNVARGKEDKRQTLFDGEFVEGGMIGPAVG